jgi:hypothetical protein
MMDVTLKYYNPSACYQTKSFSRFVNFSMIFEDFYQCIHGASSTLEPYLNNSVLL